MREKLENCLNKIRLAEGVTQQEVADGVGVTRQTIISIEKGNYVPSVLLAMKLAEYFDTSVEIIFDHSKC